MVDSFRSIIDLWPTRIAMASDIGGDAGEVSKWWQRDKIPDRWWARVVSTATANENGVTLEVLARLAAGADAEGARA